MRFLKVVVSQRCCWCKVLKHTCFAFELFAMNATPARRVTPPWHFYIANFHPGWPGYPTWQTGSPHLSYKRDKKKIIWTGRLPHLGGLPHLPGVPHLHVNRPLLSRDERRQQQRIEFYNLISAWSTVKVANSFLKIWILLFRIWVLTAYAIQTCINISETDNRVLFSVTGDNRTHWNLPWPVTLWSNSIV